ncbi:hypothetical protein BDV12DRAFT_200955 [Aspergillus spectabilis]
MALDVSSSSSSDVPYGVGQDDDNDDVSLTRPGVVFVEDDDWDMIPEGDESLEAYYELRSKIVSMGYLAYSSGNMYFFLDASRHWTLLMAKDALARICKIIGSTNVSVNTADAVEHYYPWLAKRAVVNASLPLQRSICIGTRRIEVSLDQDELIFSRSRRLADVADNADQRAAELCVLPIMMTKVPVAWKWPGGAAIYNFIVPLFRDPRDFTTFMWHIGNAVVDPIQTPRCMILAGPGGSGKSTSIKAIVTALEGCVGVLPNGTFTSSSPKVTETVLKQLVSSRMVTCGDVDLESREMDVHALRTVVSGDYITLGAFRTRIRSSLTLATNGYIDPTTDDVFTSDAVLRRIVTVYMDATASKLDLQEIPHFQEARGDFVCACVHVRLTHTYIPVTPRTVLLTIAGAKYADLERMVEECSEPTLSDYIGVLSAVQATTGIPSDDVGHKASLISRDAVIEIGKRKFLKGLRPVPGF